MFSLERVLPQFSVQIMGYYLQRLNYQLVRMHLQLRQSLEQERKNPGYEVASLAGWRNLW